MKNGIIINGLVYELQDVSEFRKNSTICEICELEDQCDNFGGKALCERLHDSRPDDAYQYIGKLNEIVELLKSKCDERED